MNILVADKDSSLRILVKARLEARNYSVFEASDSDQVLRYLERQSIDLVLLSTGIGRTSGKHLIEKIRQNPHWVTLPIILLTEQDQIAELVMSRDRGFDDFLVKPFNPLVLQLRVAIDIARSRQRVEVNALSHLPGNHSVERVIRSKIERGEKFSVLYIDINHFKSFNDRYGFEKGDGVIRQVARILTRVAEKIDPSGESFVGHVGGDDFVVVVSPDKEETYAKTFLEEFDRIIPTYYNQADQKRGHVRVTNRRGKLETFPLMSCSVAACNNLHHDYKSLGEIAQDAAEVKAFLKTQPGSHYLRDRRGAPLQALEEAVEILAPKETNKTKGNWFDPLGQVLLGAGLISEEQLSVALKKHLDTGQRLGQVLIAMNAVRSEDVGRMLERKLNVSYVCLRSFKPSREAMRLFTTEFIGSHRVVPLEIADGMVKLGMCDPFDLRTLDAIERITKLKPVPCLTLEDEFEEFLEHCLPEYSQEEAIG